MIDLNDMRLFCVVAARGSFSAAARELGAPKSSVSRGVSRLESDVGARLINRTNRSVRLTEAGERLKASCTVLLDGVSAAIEEVSAYGGSPRGRLAISAGIDFGRFVARDVLPAYLQRFPEVEVKLELSSRRVDLAGEAFDVVIRIGELPDSGLLSRRLGTLTSKLLASPAYLERNAPPRTPADLDKHAGFDIPTLDGRPRTFLFSKGRRRVEAGFRTRAYVNDPGAIRSLVLAGGGIALLPDYLCEDDLRGGDLVQLLPDWSLPPAAVTAIMLRHREGSPAVRAFVDLLVSRVRELGARRTAASVVDAAPA